MSRNVGALAAIIRALETADTYDDTIQCGIEWLAEQLAAGGVLAVDSLTDEQLTDFPFDGTFMTTGKDGELVKPAAERRAALRRCATGEP